MAPSSSAGGSEEHLLSNEDLPKGAAKVTLKSVVALTIWLGSFHANIVFCLVCFLFLPSPWAIAALAFWVSTIFIPTFSESWIAQVVARFVIKTVPTHFPIQVHVEDMDAFDPNKVYVLAVEPHGVLPIALVVLTPQYGLMPLPKIKACATSAIFWTPLLRHIWTWMGLVTASKSNISKLLREGYSTVLIPGGVQEVLYLKAGQETIVLKRRLGFIRLAIEAGASLVPCFCFGQSEVYHYWKPTGSWFAQLSRAIGFTPLVFWGMYGSPIPLPHPMYFVVGKPIEVEKMSNPSLEQTLAVQEKFIAAMEKLFETHKSSAGYESYTLLIK